MSLLGLYLCEYCGTPLTLGRDERGIYFTCRPCARFAKEHWDRNYAWRAAPVRGRR